MDGGDVGSNGQAMREKGSVLHRRREIKTIGVVMLMSMAIPPSVVGQNAAVFSTICTNLPSLPEVVKNICLGSGQRDGSVVINEVSK